MKTAKIPVYGNIAFSVQK